MKPANLKIIGIVLFFVVSAHADTLVLKSGKTLNGTMIGADARQVDFITSAGKTERILITDIDKINFSKPAPAGSATASASQNKPPAPKPSVTIPAGTLFRVRTVDQIDVDAAQAGARFRGIIDDPVTVRGNIVVPRGSDATLQAVKVQQSGRMKGSDLIQLKLNSVVVKGTPYQLITSFKEISGGSEGKKTTKKLVGGAGLGAIIGGIAGGGKGAAIGAAVGGAGGAAVSAAGQQHVKVPAETRIEFKLESDAKI